MSWVWKLNYFLSCLETENKKRESKAKKLHDTATRWDLLR